MGIGFGELLICAGVMVLLTFGAAVLFIMSRRGRMSGGREAMPRGAAPVMPAPQSRQVIFFLRFEGSEDEQYVRDIAQRHGVLRNAAAAREAALDLVRAAPTATHVFVGPASQAPGGPTLAHTGLPGGVVVGFVAHSTSPLDTVADDQDLGKVVAELRKISAWTDGQFAGGQVTLAATAVDAQAPPLTAVRKETRPGHQICRYCSQAFPSHDTQCNNCGARAAQ